MLERRQQRTEQPEPTATPTQLEPLATVEAATYSLPTNRMRTALAKFDDLSDADQVDYLTTLWGEEPA